MHENVCTYLSGNAWSNVPCEKIGMYEKIFCCYKFLQPLVLEIFLWAMEKVCPEVLYEKKWSRASLSTTFFHTRLLEKLFPLPTKRFLTLGCKNYSNKIQLFTAHVKKVPLLAKVESLAHFWQFGSVTFFWLGQKTKSDFFHKIITFYLLSNLFQRRAK